MDFRQIAPSEFVPPPQKNFWKSRVDVWASVRRHVWISGLVGLATLGAGLIVSTGHQPDYQASSVLYFSSAPNSTPLAFATYVQEQNKAITDEKVLTGAVQSLLPGTWQKPGESLSSSVRRLQETLVVTPEGQSAYRISLTGTRPQALPQIVNAVTSSYMRRAEDEQLYGKDERLQALRKARDGVQTALAQKLQASPSGVLAAAGSRQDQLRADLTLADSRRRQIQSQLQDLEHSETAASNPALADTTDNIIASDPDLLVTKSSLSLKRDLLLDKLAGAPSRKERRWLYQQLAETEAALQAMQDRLRDPATVSLEHTLREQLKQATLAEAALLTDFKAAVHPSGRTKATPKRIPRYTPEIAGLQAQYTSLDEQLRHLSFGNHSAGSVHLLSAAQLPKAPLPGMTRFRLLLLLPCAMLFAAGSVVLFDVFDRRVHSETDLEQTLGFPPLGSLFDSNDVTPHALNETTLRLAAGIDLAVRNDGVRIVVLTSVVAGGGTSWVTRQLANMLARMGRNTLAIDATGLKSPLSYVSMNMDHLAHRWVGGAPFMQASYGVGSNAVVIQPFAPKVQPVSDFLKTAFEGARTNYDLVLVDAGPLLGSELSKTLAHFADTTLVIVEAGHCTQAELVKAYRGLEELQIAGIETVLNKMPFDRASRALRQSLRGMEARSAERRTQADATPGSGTARSGGARFLAAKDAEGSGLYVQRLCSVEQTMGIKFFDRSQMHVYSNQRKNYGKAVPQCSPWRFLFMYAPS